MRLALCTLSAVLLSGCSWLGMGGNSSNSYNQYGAGCATGQYGGGQYAYGNQYGYAGQGGGAGCYGAGGYGVAGNGYGAGAGGYGAGAGGGAYGAGGYGVNGYGAGSGMGGAGAYGAGAGAYGAGMGANGLRGAQGATSYAMNGYGAGGGAGYGAGAGTLLGAGAGTQFGSAVGGQYVNGQWVSNGVAAGGSSTYQTVQGAPIYVPQPYPAYYGAASGGGYNYGYGYGGGLRGGGAALPFGLEAGVGTDFAIGGDLFPGEVAKPAIPGPGTVSALVPVSYKDAYGEAVGFDLATTYDLDPTTTILGRVGYSNAEGNLLSVGTVDDGAGLTEELFAEFSDLEQVTLEGGIRKYMGGWNNRSSGVRPYVGATAGFVHNNSVEVTQSSATLVDPTAFQQEYIEAGWVPTASGVIGAEMQVGPRTALAVESGIRWSDDLNTNFQSDDRWSVPLRLRGRVSF